MTKLVADYDPDLTEAVQERKESVFRIIGEDQYDNLMVYDNEDESDEE